LKYKFTVLIADEVIAKLYFKDLQVHRARLKGAPHIRERFEGAEGPWEIVIS